jgi:hypothetical protein
MSFLNKDSKSKSPQAIAGLFAEVDRELGWDKLFTDFAQTSKSKYKDNPLSPLFWLAYEVEHEYDDKLGEELREQIRQCLMYALKQRLTQEEQDALLDVLTGDITANKQYILDIYLKQQYDQKDFPKETVMSLQTMEPTTWSNVAEQFFDVVDDPSFEDRAMEILTRYNKSLGMQISGILEDCVKKNFLNKLPNKVNNKLKSLMGDRIQRIQLAAMKL